MSELPKETSPVCSTQMTPAQKKCEEETGHDFEWAAPEYDVGFSGYGRCRDCDWHVPYEAPDFDGDYE